MSTLYSEFKGKLLTPTDTDYDEARKLWNGMVDKRPALIAQCTTTSTPSTARSKPSISCQATGASSSPTAASVLGEGGVILVVDDDESNRDLLERRLKSQGYDPVTVDSGEAAIEFLGTTDVDMVLLDMIMPGLDGTEVLGRLKGDAKLKNIPVVMLSALDDMERIIECISMGAED